MKRVAASLLLLLATVACSTTATRRSILFDDFNYTNTSELAQHGWIVRTETGWPGVPDAAWGPGNVAFVDDAGNRVLRMSSSTDGTGPNSIQMQICHQRKYLEGTYAGRVRFTDAPVAGPTGDQIVETFYFISPLKAPMDPDYSEIDFEYLPNGGWGHTGPTMFATTWETFSPEPNWKADNVSSNAAGALSGWHTLVAQVGDGHVRYFVDGKPLADHDDRFYPEVMMSINFNLWFIKTGLIPGNEMRRYDEDIDWVFFRGGPVMTPAEVESAVADLRRRSVAFRDTVRPSGLPSPCNF
jgi:hypothetical protein